MTASEAIEFLSDAARYFERRDTGGEDRALWSNVYNAENCRRIAALIRERIAARSDETPLGGSAEGKSRAEGLAQ